MLDGTNRFVRQGSEADNTYYTRIDETEDHPVIGPELRKMMQRKVAEFPPFLERATKFGLTKDATIAELFVLSMVGVAINGNDGIVKLVIERLDGRVLDTPRLNGNDKRKTKTSLENLTDEQLQKMMKESDADTDAK